MPLDAARLTLTGNDVFPRSDDGWLEWVSAGRTRSFLLDDPLLDWLGLYGAPNGFLRDDQLAGYDPRLDFTSFIFRQGRAFEAAVIAHLRGLLQIVPIAHGPGDIRGYDKAVETFEAMRRGEEAIYQAVLFDAETMTYGAPDLLVRADVLSKLFPAAPLPDPSLAAPDLGGRWHYAVVDTKFTSLHLAASGLLGNGGSSPAYKAQLFLYNQALGRLQGYTPPTAYLLGRSWEQTIDKETFRGLSCMDRLAPVDVHGTIAHKRSLGATTLGAVEWVRRLRRAGHTWHVLPEPSVPELWPDMTNQQDGPWHAAKRQIAERLEDLTLLWQIGVPKRRKAHAAGVTRWTDPACTPPLLGLLGPKQGPALWEILRVNREPDVQAVSYLYGSAGALCTKDELARQVWPEYEGAVDDYNVEQLVSRLRRKLEPDHSHPRYILTVRGLGYRLEVSGTEGSAIAGRAPLPRAGLLSAALGVAISVAAIGVAVVLLSGRGAEGTGGPSSRAAPADRWLEKTADAFDTPETSLFPRGPGATPAGLIFSRGIEGGEYVVRVLRGPERSGGVSALASPVSFETFAFEADARSNGSIEYGLTLFWNSADSLQLRLNPGTASYGLFHHLEGNLVAREGSPHVRPGDSTNHLRFELSGRQLSLLINGAPAETLTLESIGRRPVTPGLFVFAPASQPPAEGSGTKVVFDNFRLVAEGD